MALEIERKFLLRDDSWRNKVSSRSSLVQGYLCADGARSIRVRYSRDAHGKANGHLTIKAARAGAARAEYEYPIPANEAQEMLHGLRDGALIEKTRHLVPHAEHVWEIDEFGGENAGLIVAEIELAHVDEAFARPTWLGDEVTHNSCYYNAALRLNPFTTWTRPSQSS